MRVHIRWGPVHRLLVACLVGLLALALAAPVVSAAAVKTKLISQSTAYVQAGGASYHPDIGDGGTAVAFDTYSNLSGTDYNLTSDVYHRSVSGKTTSYVTRAHTGDLGNGASDRPVLSSNGRYVVFASIASNLTTADNKGYTQIYRRDLSAGRTRLVSKGADGAAEYASRSADVSANGRYVVFTTRADNLTSKNTRDKWQVYLRDMKTKKTYLVSKSGAGKAADADCYSPAVSDSGRFIAFTSQATNLSSKDERGVRQVFLRDRKLGRTILVSQHPKKGKAGDGSSIAVEISGNGRYLVFNSHAANLIKWGKDSNGVGDVYKYDRVRKTVKRISVDWRGWQLWTESAQGDISADGNTIVFATAAPNVVPGVATGHWQVYRRGSPGVSTFLVSRANDGTPANGESRDPTVSDDGRFVAFSSQATNLTKLADANGTAADIFRRGPY